VLSIPILTALLVARVLLMVTPFLLAAGVVYWLFLTEFDINYYLTERPMPFWVAGILIAGLAMAMSAVVIPRLVGWAHALPLQLFENVGALKALGASEERARGHRPAISAILVGKPSVFLNTPFAEGAAAFSPDGRWLAYQSNESGTLEVYVRPFPGPGGKWQVSTAGEVQPVWSRNGKELFYWSGEQIWVASYTGQEGSFRAEKPRVWSRRVAGGFRLVRPASGRQALRGRSRRLGGDRGPPGQGGLHHELLRRAPPDRPASEALISPE
jgi:hypothetical protein